MVVEAARYRSAYLNYTTYARSADRLFHLR